MTDKLFEPIIINGLELSNRFMRSATHDGTADDSGAVTTRSVAIYSELGKGGIGLIVTGLTFISPHGQSSPNQYGIYNDSLIPGWKRLVKAVHNGGGKIAIQIAHSGINSRYLAGKGSNVLAVSNLPDFTGQPYREMTDNDIEAIINDFASAAVRAQEVGFDAIQLHGAHGHLMSQFASPLYNRRSDRWGGSPKNRRRFHLEIIHRVRRAIGKDFPLLIKFGVQDDSKNGMPLSEGLETCQMMEKVGIDGIEVSVGIGKGPDKLKRSEIGKPIFRDMASAVKQAVNVPVMVVTGIRGLETARSIIDSGDADMVSLSRPYIREPHLALRWQEGDTRPAKCTSCNRCFSIVLKGNGLECGEEHRMKEYPKK